MKWLKSLPALLSSIAAVLVAVGGILTAMQGAGNKATALRRHDRQWKQAHDSLAGNVGSFDKAMRTDMRVLRESVEAATKDTGSVMVQPTTLGRAFGVKARAVPVKSLRRKPMKVMLK